MGVSMMVMSSKEYAEQVEDNVCAGLEDGLYGSFHFITRELGCIPDYYERDKRAVEMIEAFQERYEAEWRDMVIELFEEFGMDVTPDGKEW